ncbi:MAG: hypothetical protein ABSG14_15550 [Verrucomicrobiia bacterium]
MNKRSTFNTFVRRRPLDRADLLHPSALSPHPSEGGVALILTLAILALVTLLLIAFVASMRVENAASKNFNELIKARELAKGAIDQAVAQIRQATPQRAPGGNTYVTFPGGAYVKNGALAATLYPLYSDPSLADLTNLNSGLWITGGTNNSGEFPVNNPNTAINVGWLYVDQSGNIGSKTVVSGFGKPLVGRIAYWVDDEASKINVNTATVAPGSCGDALGVCSGSNYVDLTMLLPTPFANAGNIQAGAVTHPYTTIEEIKRASASLTADIFDDNRFEVTTYSTDGNYPNYTDDLDVFDRQRIPLNPATLNTPLNITGQGDLTGVGAYTRLFDASGNLAKVFSGTGSFASKYTAGGGLKQLIANIIGYQIDPTVTAPPTDGAVPPAAYLGLARTPYINQIQIEYDATAPPNATVSRTVSVVLFFMYSGNSYNSAGEQLVITGLPTVGGLFSANVNIPVSGTIASGAYVPFKRIDQGVPFTGSPVAASGTPLIQYTRGYLLDYAQPTLPQNQIPSAGGSAYQGCQVVGDPAVHESVAGEWKQYTSSTAPSSGYPPADTSKIVMRAGPMQSVGELGFIHTPGVAYGHLTLQPGGGGGQIPDWAMLDLFTVGAGGAGRININSLINPGAAEPVTQRLVPLKALLNSVGLGANLATVAQNIYTRSYGDTYGNPNAFDTIGEVCQIASLANGASTQAGAEATIRRIGNLITVRSNTFTIWALAQSIRQPLGSTFGTFNPPPAGQDVITGEVKAQAVVERYENPPGSAPEYRLRYLRYLYK